MEGLVTTVSTKYNFASCSVTGTGMLPRYHVTEIKKNDLLIPSRRLSKIETKVI